MVTIDLENIVQDNNKPSKPSLLSKDKVLKTLNAAKDSTRSVYPEYYSIFVGAIESFKVYKPNLINYLNVCKEHVIVNFGNAKEYLSMLYKFFVD